MLGSSTEPENCSKVKQESLGELLRDKVSNNPFVTRDKQTKTNSADGRDNSPLLPRAYGGIPRTYTRACASQKNQTDPAQKLKSPPQSQHCIKVKEKDLDKPPRNTARQNAFITADNLSVKKAKNKRLLTEALRDKNLESIKKLVDAGADDPDACKEAFLMAINCGDIELMESLISADVNINSKANGGRTALHVAALQGNNDFAKYLIKNGARVDAQDENGLTPLMPVTQTEIAKTLINANANINLVNKSGDTALNYAVANRLPEIVKELLQAPNLNINQYKHAGRSPLIIAAEEGLYDIAEQLIKAGADIDAEETGGITAIHKAAKNGNTAIAKLLIDNGAQLNVYNLDRKTPLHSTIENEKFRTAKLLIKEGANVHSADRYGQDALHYASKSADSDFLSLLLDAGADIDQRDNDNCSALHYAAKNSKIDNVQFLLNKGAVVNPISRSNETPLSLATDNKKPKIIQLLTDYGADITKTTCHRPYTSKTPSGKINLGSLFTGTTDHSIASLVAVIGQCSADLPIKCIVHIDDKKTLEIITQILEELEHTDKKLIYLRTSQAKQSKEISIPSSFYQHDKSLLTQQFPLLS